MASDDYLTKWLKRGLAEPGKSQAGLARFLKISEPVVSRIVSGERPLRAHEVDRISNYFGFGPDHKGDPPKAGMIKAPVVAVSLEGYWTEKGRRMIPSRMTLEVVPHPHYSGTDHYVVEVRNSEGSPPSMAICIKIDDLGREPRKGDHLHVVRDKDGMEQELIRRVERQPNGQKLVLADLVGREREIPLDAVTVKGIVTGIQTLFDIS